MDRKRKMGLPKPVKATSLEKKMRTRRGLLLGMLLALAGLLGTPEAPGQAANGLASGALASIRGSVVLPDGTPVPEAVKVTLKVMRGDQAIVYTDQQGRFELSGLTPGDYTLEIQADRNRYEVTTEKVSVQRNVPTFATIYLKEKQSERRAVSGRTVSVAMLDQKVPGAAKREFESATRLAAQGKLNESTEALRRAIAIYPDYLMAHNDLGAQLLEQGKLDEAVEQFRAAVRIDPNAFNAQLNLGIALARQNKFADALAALDKALTLEPSAPAVHLYAGIACVGMNDAQRGEKELKAAYELGGSPFADALVHLGRLYLTRGDREMALKTFQTYLQESPNGANAAQVQKLVATLH